MNTIWSTYIQKIDTLYLTRTLRFSDIFKEKYQKAFKIDNKRKILEIGCGPGALSQALYRWYPNAEIVGIDRDSNFIDFASKQAPQIVFMEDDATGLSFQDKTFDVTISYTVQEHIEPAKFFGEQYRVLKDDGVCLVLSARRGINV
ncbi:MAG: class I SAM-dependent methyltransferase, partial [Clostridiaceae bacterium]|nr:class I SAM-dependent methyltransferase [Clostridiaceae bacterium]